MIKSFLNVERKLGYSSILSLPKYYFTIYSNQHQRATDIIADKTVKYDILLAEYDKVVQAFVEKRWTKKEELPAKIYIIDPLDEIAETLKLQKLPFMKQLYDGTRLQKMYESEELNSQYIQTTVFEEHFKPMIDEYLKKVLISGRVVPMSKRTQYQEIVDKCKNIYMRFFYGDPLTEFEIDVEQRYLVNKQKKYMKYIGTARAQYKCTWTYSQQRRMEGIKNYHDRDLKYYDDFRPIYEPLNMEKKLDLVKQNLDLNDDPWYKRLFFNLIESRSFKRTSARDIYIVQTLLVRAMYYTMSIEFTRTLNIPPDFHIEHAIVNIHTWLLADRLKKINTIESNYMAKQVENQFKRMTLEKANSIHLRKKNDFINDVNHFMLNNRIAYDRHFNKNPKTSLRPYYKLDALVWSTVFFEKVPRYSDIVYLVSEYIIKHYEYLATLDFKPFVEGIIEWDVYRIPVNFKQSLQEINPPLSAEELEIEVNSDKKIKKHYYTYDDPDYQLPIQSEVNNVVKRRFDTINRSIFETLRKYGSLDTYDFYSERQAKEKEDGERKKKYSLWNTENVTNAKLVDGEDLKKKVMQKRKSSQNK